MLCRMFSSIAGLYPPDAGSTPPHSCDYQKYLDIAKCFSGVKIAAGSKSLAYDIKHHPILCASFSHLISPFPQACKEYSLNTRIGSVK